MADANIVVSIEDGLTDSGTSTDKEGKFLIENLLEGLATVEVSVIGYKSLSVSQELKNGKVQPFRFELEEESVALEGVEVYSSYRKVNEGDLAASARIFSDE